MESVVVSGSQEAYMDDEKDRLKILLSHWVEHNSGHAKEFREWAEKARKVGQTTVCEDIMQAARQMDKGNEFLLAALGRLKEA